MFYTLLCKIGHQWIWELLLLFCLTPFVLSVIPLFFFRIFFLKTFSTITLETLSPFLWKYFGIYIGNFVSKCLGKFPAYFFGISFGAFIPHFFENFSKIKNFCDFCLQIHQLFIYFLEIPIIYSIPLPISAIPLAIF